MRPIEKRLDLLTGIPFIPKRINQKFSCPANRIKYYNNKATDLRYKSSFVNKPLLKNLRVLNELLKGKKEQTFHKEFLLGKGFNFSVHTHIQKHDNESRYAIYEYLIIPINFKTIKIIKND